MFCRKCGAKLNEDSIFCSECGSPVNHIEQSFNQVPSLSDSVLDLSQTNNKEEQEVVDKVAVTKNRKKLTVWVSIISSLVIIAAIVCVIVFMFGNSGDRFYNEGDFEKAIEVYENILEDDIENTDVRIKLAKSYMAVGEYEYAIETLDYVFEYQKGNSEVYETLLSACANENDDDLANDYYERAKKDEIPINLNDIGYAEVVDLIDLSVSRAKDIGGIEIIEDKRVADSSEKDTIIKQKPEQGTLGRLESGLVKIHVTVSDGPEEITIKNYKGKSISVVEDELGEDFVVEMEEEGSSSVEQGKIIRTEPAAGETIKKGDILTVYISSGEKMVSVPKLIGKTVDDAEKNLKSVGLRLGTVAKENSTKTNGIIIRQSPKYKEVVKENSEIDVIISES